MRCLPIVVLGAGIIFTFACAMPASAQSLDRQCAKRQTVISSLKDRYSETPVAIGLDNKGALVEVLSAEEGETWTILVTMPNGTSCVVAAGENWTTREKVAQAWQDD